MEQTVAIAPADAGLFGWWRSASAEARRALIAAGAGWMLDSFDVMLYALVLASMMTDLGLSKPTAGWLGSIALLAAAFGGIAFGVIADRFGRTRALMASVLIYSFATAACGFANSVTQLAICRVILGIGMGGEWASGAALVSETWPKEHRGKALGLMQSAWAIGYAAAAIVTWLVLPIGGWRAVFFVGVLPALLTLWVRRRVEEPAIWREKQQRTQAAERGRMGDVFAEGRGPRHHRADGDERLLPVRVVGLQPVDSRVSLAARRGRRRRPHHGAMSGLVVAMQVGMWFGYVTFGFVSDAVGRRRTYVTYLIVAAILMLVYERDAQSAAAPAARTVRRLLRHRLLQRPRRGDGGDLSHRHPRHGAGPQLQRRPHRQRRRAVRGRLARAVARLRPGAVHRVGRLHRRRDLLDLDSRNERARTRRVRRTSGMRRARPMR